MQWYLPMFYDFLEKNTYMIYMCCHIRSERGNIKGLHYSTPNHGFFFMGCLISSKTLNYKKVVVYYYEPIKYRFSLLKMTKNIK